MALGINTNIASINARNQLSQSQNLNSQALERLSSGLRINSAKDDAAGLTISTRLDSQVRGMSVAQRNANDAISMVQTAEGALDEVVNNLQRMRELAVQAANGSNGTEERAALKAEFDERALEIQRISEATSFNGLELLSGDVDGAGGAGTTATVTFQVGAGADAFDKISVDFDAMDATTLGVNALAFTDSTTIDTAITAIDTALDTVNAQRSDFGAAQNRFESVINTLSTSIENASASNSRILDADFAAESAKLAKSNVLQQAGISVLAQANARPNQVLSLLQ